MKYVNQHVMNAVQEMKLGMTKKYSIVEKADLILKKIPREKENLKVWSPQHEREF